MLCILTEISLVIAIFFGNLWKSPLSGFRKTQIQTHEQSKEARRTELFAGASAVSPNAARQRFSNTPAVPRNEPISESPFRNTGTNGTLAPMATMDREAFALREHSFIENTEARLDEFLTQGREVLDNLIDQRNVLKGTQRRLLDAANTLGLSRDVIGWIERRRYVVFVSLLLVK